MYKIQQQSHVLIALSWEPAMFVAITTYVFLAGELLVTVGYVMWMHD